MTELEQVERAKYERVWNLPAYRVKNHGLALWLSHRSIYPRAPLLALDIGCGNGRLIKHWRDVDGINGFGVDFAPNAPDADIDHNRIFYQCLWEMDFPTRFSMGNCADVMEHIPPERVDDVLACIVEHCDFTVFKIANYRDHFGDLHISLHDARWWLAKLSEYGTATQIDYPSKLAEYVFTLRAHRTLHEAST